METHQMLDEILQQFKKNCLESQLDLCPTFAHFYIHLLMRDAHEGLDLRQSGKCKVMKFIELALNKYRNPIDPTLCNIKMTFTFERCPEIEFDIFKEKYMQTLCEQMKPLIDGILQYPENSSDGQIEEMFTKIQAFTVANYCLGCPKNHVLLKQTRQSLNSVIARGDLRSFVHKLKQNRTEYLQQLTATVCGILVYNNHGPDGDKENMRDTKAFSPVCRTLNIVLVRTYILILTKDNQKISLPTVIIDLEMAEKNTKGSLDSSLKHTIECKKYGFKVISEIIELDAPKKLAHCHFPVQKVLQINRFVALFCVHERFLLKLIDAYEKTKYRIEVAENKMKCITHKVDDVLKYRTAIDSVLIFPHFVQLSEIWSELVLYINHLTVINKVKADLDEIMTPELHAAFSEVVENTQIASVQMKYIVEPTFEQLTARVGKRIGKGSLAKVAEHLKCYCALTMALTGGLLVPSMLEKKICEDINLKFGFANLELAKYAERNFEEFVCTLQSVIYTSVDLLLLFDLDAEILRQDFDEIPVAPIPKTKSFETQTEMIIENNLLPVNYIRSTWNIWDYHRETIRLADLRNRQTHSAQTVVTFGRRNTQNQYDECRRNV